MQTPHRLIPAGIWTFSLWGDSANRFPTVQPPWWKCRCEMFQLNWNESFLLLIFGANMKKIQKHTSVLCQSWRICDFSHIFLHSLLSFSGEKCAHFLFFSGQERNWWFSDKNWSLKLWQKLCFLCHDLWTIHKSTSCHAVHTKMTVTKHWFGYMLQQVFFYQYFLNFSHDCPYWWGLASLCAAWLLEMRKPDNVVCVPCVSCVHLMCAAFASAK